MMAWNVVLDNRDSFMEKWKKQIESQDLLEKYHAEKFIEYARSAKKMARMDADIMLSTLAHIKICEDGKMVVVFFNEQEFEWNNIEKSYENN